MAQGDITVVMIITGMIRRRAAGSAPLLIARAHRARRTAGHGDIGGVRWRTRPRRVRVDVADFDGFWVPGRILMEITQPFGQMVRRGFPALLARGIGLGQVVDRNGGAGLGGHTIEGNRGDHTSGRRDTRVVCISEIDRLNGRTLGVSWRTPSRMGVHVLVAVPARARATNTAVDTTTGAGTPAGAPGTTLIMMANLGSLFV